MSARGRLTPAYRRVLTRLLAGAYCRSVTGRHCVTGPGMYDDVIRINPDTIQGLEQNGFVSFDAGFYRITDAGRAVLAAHRETEGGERDE